MTRHYCDKCGATVTAENSSKNRAFVLPMGDGATPIFFSINLPDEDGFAACIHCIVKALREKFPEPPIHVPHDWARDKANGLMVQIAEMPDGAERHILARQLRDALNEQYLDPPQPPPQPSNEEMAEARRLGNPPSPGH